VVDAVVDYFADGFQEFDAGVDQVLAHFGRDVEMGAEMVEEFAAEAARSKEKRSRWSAQALFFENA
jgi:3-keto-L-gulonate-6-phosphate decarboxylase